MLLKLDNIKNKQLRRILEHATYLLIIFILIPLFIYFELCVVLPAVVHKEWCIQYCLHYLCATFLLLNIIGNMIFGMFTDTSIKGRIINVDIKENWTLCSVCECLRPPRSWHCDTCDVCVLKRDHHCTFLACCVGYYNHRYFMCFTFYIFMAMLYSFFYNTLFLSQFLKWNKGLVIGKFVFPLVSFVLDFGEESLYIFLVEINFIVGLFTGFLFIYHFNNIINGKITPERKEAKGVSYNRGWKGNITEVFGSKWYLTWIFPFINSPLPGNGVEWMTEDKSK
ncbi:probable palmitoyltransferase ZDHHC24 [Leptidea sinapis]|uniref:probable palmitoyltransferase ZDHHC24 n=1 Tax=Leptidea sinapis TaxID=189913 RepID=UPI00212CC980|nr:probable palmitoyltransferase ZDHHC24 [Leptidea sinapis]